MTATEIDFQHVDGGVLVYTIGSPFMAVHADTYEIGKRIVEKGLEWYVESRARKVLEKLRAAEEAKANPNGLVILEQPAKEASYDPAKSVYIDTSPSEMNPDENLGC